MVRGRGFRLLAAAMLLGFMFFHSQAGADELLTVSDTFAGKIQSFDNAHVIVTSCVDGRAATFNWTDIRVAAFTGDCKPPAEATLAELRAPERPCGSVRYKK